MEVVPISEYWSRMLSSGSTQYVGLIYRVPPRLWRQLMLVQNQLKKVDARHVYASPSSFHVSVKGLGFLPEEIDWNKFERVFSKIGSVLSEFPPFEIKLRGLGAFPTALYTKVEDNGNFQKINKTIVEELKGDVEASRFDTDAFIPHVTLATFNSKDISKLLEKATSEEYQDKDFGQAGVFEIEATRVNLLIALGPTDTQDGAFNYLRTFWLGKFGR